MARLYLWTVLVSCVVGCQSSATWVVDSMPAGLESQMDDTRAREDWASWNLPSFGECPAPSWVVVSPDAMPELCGMESCVGQSRDATDCVNACSLLVDGKQPIAVWAGNVPDGSTVGQLQYHEAFHILEWCAFGDPDADHSDRRVWQKRAS